MIFNIFISAFATLLIYLSVDFYKNFKQFLIFKRVREAILSSTFYYLQRTPNHFVDLNHLKQAQLEKLTEIKLSEWVQDIKITWKSVDVIQFVFELKFERLKPRYKFVIGLKDVEDMVKRM
ncbi:MAG: hypothetical protein PWQ12_21 [Clostridiales bacterium]|jgi:hypothetical protein|nr:hypothetical protein [Clostridiales bacterium]